MSALVIRSAAMIVAFVVDRLLGEPQQRWHPVVWMGRALSATGAPWARASRVAQFSLGALCWCCGAILVLGLAWVTVVALALAAARLGAWGIGMEMLVTGLLLKPLLAWRMLREEVAAVEDALARSTADGRTQLSRLVSRDTGALTDGEVRESALESLAENLNDSLIAPLFWFALAGLPGAALYRFANTADAMWGYRNHWEWAGKWAARADDALSFLPARLTALLLALAGSRWPRGLSRLARVTPSPNSGWPMAMLALVLDVRLSKPGVYVLNPCGSAPRPGDSARGLRVCERAACLGVLMSAGVTLLVAATQR
jgi:adenosylcobinamide-phosphate synthase